MTAFEGGSVFMGRLPSCAVPFGQSMSTLALSSPVGAWAGSVASGFPIGLGRTVGFPLAAVNTKRPASTR